MLTAAVWLRIATLCVVSLLGIIAIELHKLRKLRERTPLEITEEIE